MKISRKKILIAAIAVFCLFLLTIFGLELKQKCIKTVEKKNFPELIDSIEELSKDSAFSEEIKTHAYPFNLLTKHLRCEFSKEQNEEKKNALVDYAMEARRRIFFANQDEIWEKIETKMREAFIRTEKSFITSLAFGEMAEICPSTLPLACKRDNGVVFQESDEWCNRICNTLAQYEKDKDKLNGEVINFKNWGEGIKGLPGSPFEWRLAVAYRFGGKALASKICENVADEQKRKSCLSVVIALEGRGLTCEAAFKRLAQLICDYQYKNY